MTVTLQVLTLVVAVGLLCTSPPVSAQSPEDAGRQAHTLSLVLPVVIVFVLVVIIILVIVFVVYRARYGYFCCAKPRMHYRVQHSPTGSGEAGTSSEAAPTYNQPPQVSSISPPDYHDALQDVLVTSGPGTNNTPQDQFEETTLNAVEDEQEQVIAEAEPGISDESGSYDDRTPLNP